MTEPRPTRSGIKRARSVTLLWVDVIRHLGVASGAIEAARTAVSGLSGPAAERSAQRLEEARARMDLAVFDAAISYAAADDQLRDLLIGWMDKIREDDPPTA